MRLLLPRFDPQTYALDINNYFDSKTICIHDGMDWAVRTKLTYSDWCRKINSYDGYKVEGLERNRKILHRVRSVVKRKIKDIHLFVNTNGGYSFGWHSDTVEVYLFVLSGEKTVKLRNKQMKIRAGQYAYIPRGALHTVTSKPNTIAISVGL